jgi:hypothetical protein
MRLRCSERSGDFGGSDLRLFSEAPTRRSGDVEPPAAVGEGARSEHTRTRGTIALEFGPLRRRYISVDLASRLKYERDEKRRTQTWSALTGWYSPATLPGTPN